jgi:hypothetical protein
VVPLVVLSRTNSPRSTFANSFRFRSYANRPILHYFGANKSFRFRSYRHPARNPFIIRSYENPGGWHSLPSTDLHEPQSTSNRSHPSRGPLPPIFTGHEAQITGHAAPDLHNFGAPITTFRINTYISVASKRLYLPLESTLMKKGGEGEGVGVGSKLIGKLGACARSRSARFTFSRVADLSAGDAPCR